MERDPESNLDDFGARFYSSTFGRWMSPDWSDAPQPVPYANLSNPQTLNIYALVRDNPETFADLDGHNYSLLQAEQGGVGDAPLFGIAARDVNPINPVTSLGGAQPTVQGVQNQNQQGTAQHQNNLYQAANRAANVIYHETAALRAIAGQSDSKGLHDARVDAAHVYNNLSDKSMFQDSGTLSSKEQKAIAGGYTPAVDAYKDSLDAVAQAAQQPDPTNGSTHFFIRDITAGPVQHVPSWASGAQIAIGPFRTAANGDAPIHSGDIVFVWVNK